MRSIVLYYSRDRVCCHLVPLVPVFVHEGVVIVLLGDEVGGADGATVRVGVGPVKQTTVELFLSNR